VSDLREIAVAAAGGSPVERGGKRVAANTIYAYAIGTTSPLPSFTTKASFHEVRYSLAFLLRREDLLLVFLAGGATLREGQIARKYVRLESEEVSRALDGAANERVRALSLTNMSIARHAVHQRTFRGEDIEAAVPSASQNRHVAGRIETSLGAAGRRVANLATGHIGESGGKLNVDAFIEWASQVVDRLRDQNAIPLTILGRYAHSVRFSELARHNITPTGALFDLAWLREQVEEEGWIAERFLPGGMSAPLSTAELSKFLEQLSHSCVLVPHSKRKSRYQLQFEASVGLDSADAPELHVNKRSIAVTGLV